YQLGRAGGRKDTAFEPLQVLRGDPKVLRALVDLAQRLGLERFALVEGQQLAELVAPLLDRFGDLVQPLRALESLELRHRCACPVGGLDRALRVGSGAFRDLGDDLAGGGTVRVEELTAFRLDPTPVDEHLLDRASYVDPPRVSNPRAAAIRAKRSGSPEWLYSITGPSKRAVRAP